jgi:hypothetical protein
VIPPGPRRFPGPGVQILHHSHEANRQALKQPGSQCAKAERHCRHVTQFGLATRLQAADGLPGVPFGALTRAYKRHWYGTFEVRIFTSKGNWRRETYLRSGDAHEARFREGRVEGVHQQGHLVIAPNVACTLDTKIVRTSHREAMNSILVSRHSNQHSNHKRVALLPQHSGLLRCRLDA